MSHGISSGVTNGDQTSFDEQNVEIISGVNEINILKNVVQVITNKFPEDMQSGKEFSHKHNMNDDTVIVGDHIREVDFIVDLAGNIHFGRGHAFLSRRADVQAAGTVKIGAGNKIRRITNGSGHYRPNAEETARFIKVFEVAGYDVRDSWLTVYDLRRSPSGNHTDEHGVIYDGPAKRFRR